MNRLRHLLALLFVTVFTFGVYEHILSYRSFGPEYAGFWFFDHNLTFREVLDRYSWLDLSWYRPTAFVTPYWIAGKFLDWQNVTAWKALNLGTALACAPLLYALVQILFGRRVLAGILAALYFLVHPCLYVVVFEISAFDFTHVFFGLLTGVLYLLALRRTGIQSLSLTIGAVMAYAAALTSKEITIVTPVFLFIASALTLIERNTWRTRWTFEAARLLPFVLLIVGYYFLHIRHMAKDWQTAQGDYRTKANVSIIVENAVKYPLWMARNFILTGDHTGQGSPYANRRNTAAALALTLIVVWMWLADLRNRRELWTPFALLIAWVLVFLMVPIYSGGHLWHANLALAGYAAFAGYGLSRAFERLPNGPARTVAVIAFLAGFFALGRANATEFLQKDARRPIYRLIYQALTTPPVPAEKMKGSPVVFVEDRAGLGWWAFGGGSGITPYVYRNPKIKEKLTPPLDQVPPAVCQEWTKTPSKLYFRYDAKYRWFDATAEFNQYCDRKLETAAK